MKAKDLKQLNVFKNSSGSRCLVYGANKRKLFILSISGIFYEVDRHIDTEYYSINMSAHTFIKNFPIHKLHNDNLQKFTSIKHFIMNEKITCSKLLLLC